MNSSVRTRYVLVWGLRTPSSRLPKHRGSRLLAFGSAGHLALSRFPPRRVRRRRLTNAGWRETPRHACAGEVHILSRVECCSCGARFDRILRIEPVTAAGERRSALCRSTAAKPCMTDKMRMSNDEPVPASADHVLLEDLGSAPKPGGSLPLVGMIVSSSVYR